MNCSASERPPKRSQLRLLLFNSLFLKVRFQNVSSRRKAAFRRTTKAGITYVAMPAFVHKSFAKDLCHTDVPRSKNFFDFAKKIL